MAPCPLGRRGEKPVHAVDAPAVPARCEAEFEQTAFDQAASL